VPRGPGKFIHTQFKGIPKRFVGLRYQGQTPHIFRKSMVCCHCRLRRQGQQKRDFPENVWFWGPWYPRPPKNNLATKPLRDPFDHWSVSGPENDRTAPPAAAPVPASRETTRERVFRALAEPGYMEMSYTLYSASGQETGLPERILAGLLPGYRESTDIGPPDGLRPAGGPIRCFPGSSLARKADLRPGSTIA
jgi:hypothetical protein